MNYQEINAKTIDKWCEEDWEWGRPISHEGYVNALHGKWGVYLTPTKVVPHAWFGDLKKKGSGACQRRRSADLHFFGTGSQMYRAGLLP